MDEPEKQDITTGSGVTPTPILASESAPTVEPLEPSQPSTSIESASTRPLSLQEVLSLLQTNCFDLRLMNCEVAILARGRRLYVIAEVPASIGSVAIEDGHITLNGQPVVNG